MPCGPSGRQAALAFQRSSNRCPYRAGAIADRLIRRPRRSRGASGGADWRAVTVSPVSADQRTASAPASRFSGSYSSHPAPHHSVDTVNPASFRRPLTRLPPRIPSQLLPLPWCGAAPHPVQIGLPRLQRPLQTFTLDRAATTHLFRCHRDTRIAARREKNFRVDLRAQR